MTEERPRRRTRPALVDSPPLNEAQIRYRARRSDNPPPPATDYDTAVCDLDQDATRLRDQILMNTMTSRQADFLRDQMTMERTLFLSVALQQLVETRRIANALENLNEIEEWKQSRRERKRRAKADKRVAKMNKKRFKNLPD